MLDDSRHDGVAFVLDITERKRTEEVLRQRNERLAQLSETVAHLLTAEDPTLMVRELFEKVCRHLDVHVYFNFMVNDQGDALRLDSFAGSRKSWCPLRPTRWIPPAG
jgi:PAS domain-containing protein